MRRFIRYDHLENVIGEIDDSQIISLVRHERINGEHSLEVTTTQVLDKNERVVYQDGRGIWREYVVSGVDQEHATGERYIGTYNCVWSVQPDLMGVIVSVMPGTQTPVRASVALASALSAQSRWTVGTVTNMNYGGASMYDMQTWNAIKVLVQNWGGELDTTISVNKTNVITRAVDLYSKQGEQTAKRRFDFGSDLSSIKRTYADTPFYCRISPRGKGEQTESGGYGRKVTIESVNGGRDYLEYTPMVDVCKIRNGNGWIYPTIIVENGQCSTPSELLVWARSVLEDYCTPKITYEVDVIQAAIEGIDLQGVSLGDTVQIVDRKFGNGLRLSGRVIEMEVDELNERSVKLKIGTFDDSLSGKFSSFDTVASTVKSMNGGTFSTADYLSRLLERINGEINATGGYTYITEGHGLRTYDTAVSDPLVGSEASSVVEIKGGTIRIANSKTAQGEWEWKTVFTSGHIAADLVTAVNVTAGRIESANGESYWDLDGNQLVTRNADLAGKVTATSGTIGGMTIENTQLSNDFMILKDNALLFKARNATRTVSGIVGVKGEGSASGVYGAVFGSFESASYGQFIGLNYNLADGNPPDTGLPFLAYTTRSILLYNKYYYANRLNFPVDLEILDNAEIYLPYKSSGVIYHDKGLTQNVAVGNTLLKFRKGLLVGTGSA